MAKKLSRREFQEIVHDNAGREYRSQPGSSMFSRGKPHDREVIELTWSGGGVYGGNCWGDEANIPREGEPEPPFEQLDNILLEVCPNMGFLQYKALLNLVEFDSKHEYEYYGNSSITNIKSIKVGDLWDFLLNHSLIEEGTAELGVYYYEIYKNPQSKRKRRGFIVAKDKDTAQSRLSSSQYIPDGYFTVVCMYNQDDETHRKEFNKLNKTRKEELTPYM